MQDIVEKRDKLVRLEPTARTFRKNTCKADKQEDGCKTSLGNVTNSCASRLQPERLAEIHAKLASKGMVAKHIWKRDKLVRLEPTVRTFGKNKYKADRHRDECTTWVFVGGRTIRPWSNCDEYILESWLARAPRA